MNNIAVIDLGTNTFNISIGRIENSNLFIEYNHKIGVALGLGGINDGFIHDDAIARAIEAFKEFKLVIIQFNIKKIIAIGTSALRNAKNALEFCNIIQEEFNIEIQIVSGEREAELIYKGVQLTKNLPSNYVILDIGGGSTELIKVVNNSIEEKKSFNIGVSRIYQLKKYQDPFTIDDISFVTRYLHENTKNLESLQSNTLVGASGSFETFYELIYHKTFSEKEENNTFNYQKFEEILNELIHSTEAERNKNDFIIPIRKIMAPITAIKTKWLINELKCNTIVVSPYALKEGVFYEHFSNR